MCEQCSRDDIDIRDKLSEKLSIMEAVVFGAMDNIDQYDPNSDVINGLYFGFAELREVVNEAMHKIDD